MSPGLAELLCNGAELVLVAGAEVRLVNALLPFGENGVELILSMEPVDTTSVDCEGMSSVVMSCEVAMLEVAASVVLTFVLLFALL